MMKRVRPYPPMHHRKLKHTDTLSGRWLAVCGPGCLQLETNIIKKNKNSLWALAPMLWLFMPAERVMMPEVTSLHYS